MRSEKSSTRGCADSAWFQDIEERERGMQLLQENDAIGAAERQPERGEVIGMHAPHARGQQLQIALLSQV